MPFVASSNLPGFRAHRAGERALLKSEQFRFEQFAGKRRAIHFDERLVAARRAHVDHARDDFFSHAAFAINEYRHIHRSDLQDLLADANHLRAGGQEAKVLGDRVAIFAQRLVFRAKLLLLPALQHGHVEFGLFKWLGQVILRAQADGFDDVAHFVRAGKHDHVE